MLSKDEITARSLRLSGRAPNPYTGTANDPFQEAQSQYAGPGWGQFFGALQKQEEDAHLAGQNYRVGWGGFGNAISESGGGASMPRRSQSLAQMRPASVDEGLLSEEGQRSWAINTMLSHLTDNQRREAQALRGMTADADIAQSQASLAKMSVQDQQAIDRAYAVANTPGVTRQGRPIDGSNGRYATMGGPAPPMSPPEQQALALEGVPGHLQPKPPPPVTFGAPTAAMVDGKRVFVRAGSDGQMYGTDRKPIAPEALAPEAKAAAVANPDVADAVAGMIAGRLPPQMPGRASKDYLAVQGEAERQGYDLSAAVTDWNATQKHINTMNGAQQLRLNQAVNSLPEMLDSVEELATQWKAGQFPILTKANLALAKNGALGPEAASVATRLEAQIADVVADLGNVYMGGNSPTERALELAGKSLQSEWSERTLLDGVAMARKNVQIRQNSIRNTGVAGASATNPYAAPAATGGGGATPLVASVPAGGVTVTDPRGGVHVFPNQAAADAFKQAAGIR